jgi:hypothetical protein
MVKKHLEEVEPIDYSDESEEEEQPKTSIKKKVETVETISAKTGKPKRVMSEKQKKILAEARVLARARRAEIKEMHMKEKEMKKEQFLIRKLELEKKVKEHENKIRKLAYEAGHVTEEQYENATGKKVRKKSVKKDPLEDDEEDLRQRKKIEELEEKLNEMKKSHCAGSRITASKPKVIKEESESEEEIEEDIELPKRGRGTPAKKPISRSTSVESTSSRTGAPKVKLEEVEDVPNESKRFKNKNPMVREQEVSGDQKKLMDTMRHLFPTGGF